MPWRRDFLRAAGSVAGVLESRFMEIVTGPDGVARCGWGASTDDYVAYHDDEWGVGVADDRRLFEKICLEGFQSGLSWLTILRKRDNFRAAFADFDIDAVAAFGEDDVERLLGDAGIVRHQGKIRSTINNAARARALIAEHGSLAAYFWPHATFLDEPVTDVPAVTDTSTRLSKSLKRAGWSFVGPTTMYAFMQAMGLVNDHVAGCDAWEPAEVARRAAARSVGVAAP
jgi:DNA-3-methyladenine glycosylase I